MGKAIRLCICLGLAGLMLAGCSASDVTADVSAGRSNASTSGEGASVGGEIASARGEAASAGFEPLENDLFDAADSEDPVNSAGPANSAPPDASPNAANSPDPVGASDSGATTAPAGSAPTAAPGADDVDDPGTDAVGDSGADASGGPGNADADLLPAAGPGLPPELPASAIPASPVDYPLDAKANGFTEKDRKKASGQTLIGALIIPAIDFRETIVAGADKAAIKKNVGRLGGSCNPGEFGQCIITGHRYYDWGNMFNRLDELVVGDKVDAAMPDGRYYRYIVREVILSEPKPYDLFYPNGKFEMTLVTCHPIHVSTHQLLIRCELQTVVEKDGTQHAPVKPE